MSISDIDVLLDRIINDFYITVVNKDKLIDKLTKDDNIVQHQKYILETIENYSKKIDREQIKKIVSQEENVERVVTIFRKYLSYYIFLATCLSYKSKDKTFVNNLLEISKNKGNYEIQIKDFFISETNSLVLKFSKLIKSIITLLNSNIKEIEILAKKQEYHDAIVFLNSMGNDVVTNYFKKDGINIHNIITAVLVHEVYKKIDKKELSRLIEDTTAIGGEFIYIDVVVSKNININYDSIERLLTEEEKKYNVANILYDMIDKNSNISNILSEYVDTDQKIRRLLDSKIVVPIVDDFLLYHKDSERYESQKSSMKSADKKQSLTKVKYIVDKIDSASKYNTVADKDKADDIWYLPNLYSKYLLVNYYENISILNKIMTVEKITDNYEYYHDFFEYFYYPFVNFKTSNKYSFRTNLNKTTDTIRVPYKNKLFWHASSRNTPIDIVGLMFKPSNIPVECVELTDKSIINNSNVENTYEAFIDKIKTVILDTGNNFKPVLWLFDMDKYTVNTTTYEKKDELTHAEIAKLTTSNIYDKLIEIVYLLITDILEKHKTVPIQLAKKIVSLIEESFIEIPKMSEYYQKLVDLIYFKKSHKVADILDKNEDKIIDYKELKTPRVKNSENSFRVTVTTDVETDTAKEAVFNTSYVCQHNITWNSIVSLKRSDPNRFVNVLEDFMKQYIIMNQNRAYVCRSCGYNINIQQYDIDGNFDSDTGQFVPFGFSLNIDLSELPEYKALTLVITNIESQIEKIATIANIQLFYGKGVKSRRVTLVKSIIDLVQENNKEIIKANRVSNGFDGAKYGIIPSVASSFKIGFELDNMIYSHSANSKTLANRYKKNYVYSYIIVSILFELNDSHLLLLRLGDKICNYEVFNTKAKHLLDNNKLIVNKELETDKLNNYNLLAYSVYYFSCVIVRYGLWNFDIGEVKSKEKEFTIKIKIIVDTIMSVMNSLIVNSDKSDVLHKFAYKYFVKLSTMFNKDKTIISLKKHTDNVKQETGDVKTEMMPLFGEYAQKLDDKIYAEPRTMFNKMDKRKSIKAGSLNTEYISKKVLTLRNGVTKDNMYISLCDNDKDSKFNKNICKDFKEGNITDNNYIDYLNHSKLFSARDKAVNKMYTDILKDNLRKETMIKNSLGKYKSNTSVKQFVENIKNITGATFKLNDRVIDMLSDKFTILVDNRGAMANPQPVLKGDIENLTGNLTIKKNDKEFTEKKTDNIYSFNYHGKVDIYFDYVTHALLGYKEDNKIKHVKEHVKGLSIDLSVQNKLRFMGFSKLNYFDVKYSDIFIDRLNNLKNIFSYIQRLYNNMFFRTKTVVSDEDITFEEEIIQNYKSKFRGIERKQLFKDWDAMLHITPTHIDDNSVRKYISIIDTVDKDTNGNVLLNYIVDSMDSLINSYSNRIEKMNIINFFVEVINYVYSELNKDSVVNTLELKQFQYRLDSSGYVYDNEDMNYLARSVEEHTEGLYGEYIDSDADEADKNAKHDDKEESDAIDVDGEFDYEGNYEKHDV